MSKKLKKIVLKTTSIFLMTIFVLTIFPCGNSLAAQENTSEELSTKEILGSPKTAMDEGNFLGKYWVAHVSGSGADCYVTLNYEQTSQLNLRLDIYRSKGFWQIYDIYTMNSTTRGRYAKLRWQDGLEFVARRVDGYFGVNGNWIGDLTATGWW